MADVFQEILNSLRTEGRLMLATIISTSGSTPASAFSKMLIKPRMTIGTVGGGDLEANVIKAAHRLSEANKVEIMSFHLDEKELVQGLICGGDVEVSIEPVEKEDLEVFETIANRRNNGEDCILATLVSQRGQLLLRQVIESEEKILKSAIPIEHRTSMIDELHKALHRHETRKIAVSNGMLILEPILGRPGLVIFGGGHVSKHLCRIASMAGFRVTVVDERKEYANAERFPEAEVTLSIEFSKAFQSIDIKPSTYVVIVTRSHQSDEEVLRKAVKTPARYIGMIGSKRKIVATYEQLLEQGITVGELERIHAPMGIEIGAATAEEIGISIAAEMIAIRRGEGTPFHNKSEVLGDFFTARRLATHINTGMR
ncbi:MAG: XdhC family protein [Ignavibacteriales bacterium]|nr:XdhC family protein [Ignavibacteriales bacterium]